MAGTTVLQPAFARLQMTPSDLLVPPRGKLTTTAIVLAAAMCIASAAGLAARPEKATRTGSTISLESAVPKVFGAWKALPEQTSLIVNPQAAEYLYGLYSQVLSRTYVDQNGYRVMLSVAYNDDNRGGLQTHRPEVCYPAQGFKVGALEDGRLPTPFGDIEVRRLMTNLGERVEPVTYWVTVGNEVVNNRLDKRLAEMKMALTGQVPDGLLFRVSSIDAESSRAYAVHQRFTADMMGAVPLGVRKQLSGLAGQTPPP